MNVNRKGTPQVITSIFQCAKVLICAVRPEGAFHQWREDPPRELSIALVADERFGWVTNRIEAS